MWIIIKLWWQKQSRNNWLNRNEKKMNELNCNGEIESHGQVVVLVFFSCVCVCVNQSKWKFFPLPHTYFVASIDWLTSLHSLFFSIIINDLFLCSTFAKKKLKHCPCMDIFFFFFFVDSISELINDWNERKKISFFSRSKYRQRWWWWHWNGKFVNANGWNKQISNWFIHHVHTHTRAHTRNEKPIWLNKKKQKKTYH